MIIQRELYHTIKQYVDAKEAIVVTGMRRTGKTTLMRSVYDEIDSQNKLFLDLESPINQSYFEEKDYERVKQHFEFQGVDLRRKAYIFLDEIQFVRNLPSVVKYLGDHYDIKFFLTGSSSFYLKNLFSESLAGRKFIFELFPLSFREFLLLKGEQLVIPVETEPISRTIFIALERHYDEYLMFGGFPGVVGKSSTAEKKLALQDIFTSYYQLEVQQLGDFKKSDVVRDLMLLLMQRTGSKLDIQKIASELGVSRPTIYDYLSFLAGTYFITLLKPYSASRDVEVRRGREKVYICDSGLLNSMAQVDIGALFENNIFQLLRSRGVLHYYQKRGGAEIDFIVNRNVAYEVKHHAGARDVERLTRESTRLGMESHRVVSRQFVDVNGVVYGFSL